MSSVAVVILAGFAAAGFVAGRLFLRIFQLQFEQFHEDELERARRARRRARIEQILQARRAQQVALESETQKEKAETAT